MPRALLLLFLFCLLFVGSAGVRGCPLGLSETEVVIGDVRLAVEVAATEVGRYCGLSKRDVLGEGRGMLFVFKEARTRFFTMRDTRVPLSIAFVDDARRIIDVQRMNPGPASVLYRSAQPARYALEVNQGWFAENGIEVGAELGFVLSVLLRVE